MSYNKTILMGNLTRDPELKRLQSDMAVCGFTIAVNRKYKDTEEVSFIDCESWGKTAELIAQYFTKGNPILVDGRLKQDNWEDKEGNKRSKLKLVVENFAFVGSKSESTGQASNKPLEVDIPF